MNIDGVCFDIVRVANCDLHLWVAFGIVPLCKGTLA